MNKVKIIIIGFILIVLLFTFWIIFYSNIFINNLYFIPLRSWVDQNIKEKIYPYLPSTLPYSISVRETYTLNGQLFYAYTIIGKLISTDYLSDTITIQDKDGTQWKFKYDTIPPSTDQNYWQLHYTELLFSKNLKVTSASKKFLIYKDNLNKNTSMFEKEDTIAIFLDSTEPISSYIDEAKSNITISDQTFNSTQITIGLIKIR